MSSRLYSHAPGPTVSGLRLIGVAAMVLAWTITPALAQSEDVPPDTEAPAESAVAEPPVVEEVAEPVAAEANEAVEAVEAVEVSSQPEPETAPEPEAAAAPEAQPAQKELLGGMLSHGADGLTVAGFNINGRFDVAYELGNFAIDVNDNIEDSLKNYHHFLFVSRNQADEWFSFTAEVIDLSFYEIGLKLSDEYGVRLGKILVPFGSDPLFHHSYGGLSGFDQDLVPFIWAEHGAVFEANLYQTDTLSLDNDIYVVAGISGSEDQVLRLTGASDPGTLAFGDRLRVGYDKYAAAFSFYADRYAEGRELYIWGADFSAGYGFLPWPYLNRLSAKVGFIRADVRSESLGNYFHFGDYLQLDYRLPWVTGLRYRTGIITVENHRGAYFDDRDARKGADDSLAHSITLWKRYRGLSFSAEYIFNIEAAGEVDNDLLRFTAAVEF